MKGLATAPLLLPTGRVIETDGFDSETGLLLMLTGQEERWPGIPAQPTLDEAKTAMDFLWKPFQDFPFNDDVSRGSFLAALLTACVRPGLPTSPGFFFTAPSAGSGKTLLATCLANLASERAPVVLPGLEGRQQDVSEELRKRLHAIGRAGAPVVILDNLSGQIESGALCTWLTAPDGQYEDRILGVSQMGKVSARSLLILTGNNVQLRGDLCRRVLTARIDTGMEKPWARSFPLEPASYCREHRLEMVGAALIVLRAGLQHGPAMKDRTASFEQWSDFVRRAVLMVKEREVLPVGDPIESIDSSYALDPETQKLSNFFNAAYAHLANARWTVAEIISIGKDESLKGNGALLNAIEEIAGVGAGINSRFMGRWVERQNGRIIGNFRLNRWPVLVNGTVGWKIEKLNKT